MESEMSRETAQIADGIPRPKASDSTQHWSRLGDAVTPLTPEACVAIIVDLKCRQSGTKRTLLTELYDIPRRKISPRSNSFNTLLQGVVTPTRSCVDEPRFHP